MRLQVPQTVRRISGLAWPAAAMRPMVGCEDPWRYRNKVCCAAGGNPKFCFVTQCDAGDFDIAEVWQAATKHM